MEFPIDQTKEYVSREQMERDFVVLAKNLAESGKAFDFPGLDPGSYAKLKAGENALQEPAGIIPADIMPIDDLIERFTSEGIKVVLGTDQESGNVFIVPAKCGDDDIVGNSVFPRHLRVISDMDEDLNNLVAMSKSLKLE